jgi:hypothetical protein
VHLHLQVYALYVTGVHIVSRMDVTLRADLPAFFSSPRLPVVFEAVRCCRKISVFPCFQRRLVDECDLLGSLLSTKLLQASNPALPYEAGWSLANVACSPENHARLGGDIVLMAQVINLLSHPTTLVQQNAARVLHQLGRTETGVIAVAGSGG